MTRDPHKCDRIGVGLEGSEESEDTSNKWKRGLRLDMDDEKEREKIN